MYSYGPTFAPFIYLSYHFMFFFVFHCYAMINMFSYEFHTFSIVLWLTVSIWNGSCFYMDYFAKKYEASLQRLAEVEE